MRAKGNPHKRKGAALIWGALFFMVLLGLMAILIDFGRGYLAVHQVQNAADAAALAGARYVPLVYDPNTGLTDPRIAKRVAQDYGLAHYCAKLPVHLDDLTDLNPADYLDGSGDEIALDYLDPSLTADIVIGRYVDPRYDSQGQLISGGLFYVDHVAPDSMLVIARRGGTALAAEQPDLKLLLGSAFGVDTAQFKRYAIAKCEPDFGAGVLALGECDCPGIIFDGGGVEDDMVIFGGGSLYINSPYAPGGNDGAIDQSGNAKIVVNVTRINVAGTIDANFDVPDNTNLNEGALPEPDPYAYLPTHDLAAIRAMADQGTIADSNEPQTYSPGYYSGGIQISSSDVHLEPGHYYLDSIKPDDTLYKASMSMNGGLLTGEGVTLHIIGDADYGVDIKGNTVVDISSPTGGTYAGIGIYQKRDPAYADPNYACAQSCEEPWQKAVPISNFNGGGILDVDGAVYMPHNRLELGGTGDIILTQVVADRFLISGTGKKEVYYKGEREIAPRSWLVK